MAARRTTLHLSACLLLAACGDRAPSGPARRVILITCDTLRADRLGFMGYERPVSPNLDALAAESVVYDHAWSAAPLTGPSVSALLTGRFPDEIGAGPTNRELMPEEVLTIAEVAQSAGIPTAAFVSNGVLRRPPPEAGDIGVQQGFGLYDDEMRSREMNRDLVERTAGDCTDAVLAWLAGRGAGEPYFLWVHYQDPHGPYTPPAEDLAPFERPRVEEAALPVGANHSGKGQIPKYQALEGLVTPRPYEDRYDGEIRHFDRHVGRLVDALRERGELDDALLVFTADHGEHLGEHDYWFCHGETLHRELVRVPLFLRHPRAVRERAEPPMGGARRVARVVGHVDLWPTFLDALGLAAERGRGASLLAPALPPDRVMPQFLGPLLNPNRSLAVTHDRWRALIVKDAPPRLYDLAADPRETTDLAGRHPEVLADLQARYLAFMQQDARPWSKAVRPALDPARRRALEGLGYTAGDGD